jgi:hypothetical protein
MTLMCVININKALESRFISHLKFAEEINYKLYLVQSDNRVSINVYRTTNDKIV